MKIDFTAGRQGRLGLDMWVKFRQLGDAVADHVVGPQISVFIGDLRSDLYGSLRHGALKAGR